MLDYSLITLIGKFAEEWRAGAEEVEVTMGAYDIQIILRRDKRKAMFHGFRGWKDIEAFLRR